MLLQRSIVILCYYHLVQEVLHLFEGSNSFNFCVMQISTRKSESFHHSHWYLIGLCHHQGLQFSLGTLNSCRDNHVWEKVQWLYHSVYPALQTVARALGTGRVSVNPNPFDSNVKQQITEWKHYQPVWAEPNFSYPHSHRTTNHRYRNMMLWHCCCDILTAQKASITLHCMMQRHYVLGCMNSVITLMSTVRGKQTGEDWDFLVIKSSKVILWIRPCGKKV